MSPPSLKLFLFQGTSGRARGRVVPQICHQRGGGGMAGGGPTQRILDHRNVRAVVERHLAVLFYTKIVVVYSALAKNGDRSHCCWPTYSIVVIVEGRRKRRWIR